MQAKLSVFRCLALLLLQAGAALGRPPSLKSLLLESASFCHLPASFLFTFILTSFESSQAFAVIQ